jgi:hypothetical protein
VRRDDVFVSIGRILGKLAAERAKDAETKIFCGSRRLVPFQWRNGNTRPP